MVGKVLLRHNYIPGTGLGARGQGISLPIDVEEYKHRRGLGFRPSCHEIIEARRGNHLHCLATYYGRLNRGIPVPPLSHFFPGPPLIIESTYDGPSSDFDDTTNALPTVYAVTEEIPSGVHIRPAQENEELNNWTSVLRYSAVIADTFLGEPGPIYFEEGLDEDSVVPEIEESLRRLEDCQLTSLEPTEEINVGTEEEPRFLEVCNYSEWVANIVPVEKKDGRVQVCVDYRDLNKASPKDNFPLPHIDILVNNTARHAQFSFMDGFFGYNQIRMAEEDKIKTTFTTMWGTFCYRVMPFGLKNAVATYQRAMVTLFHDMMHREVEVYVDDMIAKSKEGEDHLVNLKRLFDRLKELNYIARFIANLTDKCQPLFRLLRKNAAIEWDEECQKAFDTIKAYLVRPPVLVPPTPGRPLVLYLTVCRQSLGCMLGQEEESTHTESAIYYLSKMFTDGESNYPEIEKMCCALVWVMQRLRQYMLYHTIRLLSKADPLKYLLDSPSSMRNLAKWRCQLTEYDIEYVSRTSWKTKDAKLVPYHEYLEKLTENFEDISFTYTPRMTNQFADALATLASMVSITKENLIEPLEIEIAEGPAHCNSIEAFEAKPW
ncbi:hypothetical protein CRG98_037187 [Punica granatum]|uniref:G-patch domain-containing protein n=1 Tax=Punica granatum TaxID=22663 RepID=A0A2I0IEK1_PUNGR|nr:hypothetical protein CRG98_037187 [Punica granatum]